jgi:hypothetical protein
LRIANRTQSTRSYRIVVSGAEAGSVVVPVNPFPVDRGATETTSLFVSLPPRAFQGGEPTITVRITGDDGYDESFTWHLLGPANGRLGSGEKP